MGRYLVLRLYSMALTLLGLTMLVFLMLRLIPGTVVEQMIGGSPQQVPERYRQASAISMLPLTVPQTLVWGERDTVVPPSLGKAYVAAARHAGGVVDYLGFPKAGHFEIASPAQPSWPLIEARVKAALGTPARKTAN